ncbi:MAG TPA: SMR family transporter [Rhodanobacteraceae bacterium]|nr:SMR family transporter [Rhodanobacteraceae bacterium]
MTGWVFLGMTIAATVVAQLAFKQHFLSRRKVFIPIAAVLFCLAVVCTYFAVRELGIGRVYVGAALTYVLAPLAAHRLFGEHLGRNQLLALGLIVAGVVIYNV